MHEGKEFSGRTIFRPRKFSVEKLIDIISEPPLKGMENYWRATVIAFSGYSIRATTYVDVRRRTSTYIDVRRRTSTYIDVHRRTWTCVDVHGRASTYVDVRRRTWTYVDARRRTSTYVQVRFKVNFVLTCIRGLRVRIERAVPHTC